MPTSTLPSLADLIVATLGLQPPRDQVGADTPLFGVMPELDSLALVELITVIEEHFGFVMDEQDITFEVFETAGSLAEHIDERLSQVG